ncbi:phage tail tube protein [Tardiphaga sp. 866_E4_N2_1]|jgi:predicted secreted protein|uniref:phage tail tube protein n=1 Tax=unclassified Tardiphaga TaxID=2631404 RepID=UPI001E5AC543|nr:phage tail tube protein [Tardiphaga sp. 37S4]UFS77222.1 phage tail protein [Tardiphaga sp. 37S4]
MARADTVRFSEFLIKLGDGASPEVFAQPCGATSRGFKRTAALSETNVPDCADEDAPSWLERDVTSNSASCDFSGVVDKDDFTDWDDYFESGETKNVQITLGTLVWLGPFKISDLEITGQRGQRVTFTATLQSDGQVSRTTP